MKDGFFQKNGLFFAVLSLLLIFWLVIVMSIAPAYAATVDTLPEHLQELPSDFETNYYLVYKSDTVDSFGVYQFSDNPPVFLDPDNNRIYGHGAATSYVFYSGTSTSDWQKQGSGEIGSGYAIFFYLDHSSIVYSSFDVLNGKTGDLYYGKTELPDLGGGGLGSDDSGGVGSEEDDTQDTIVNPIIDGIKDFFTWLFSPILELVDTIANWFNTMMAFYESLDLSSIFDLNDRLGDISFAPVEEFLNSLNLDAISAFMQIWEFDLISHLVIAVVSILLVGGIIKLCMSL